MEVQAVARQDAFDLLPDPAVILAADGALVRANDAFPAIFRHWIGPQRPPWGRVQPPPFDGDTRRFEATAPDGRRFEWIERRLADGARLAIARDISRHVSAAEEALRAKTTLFATLTHELRTPLNGILGMAGLLAMGKQEPNAKSYTDAIKQSGELLLDLITEILDYSRLDTGRISLESSPFDPEAAMQDVAELLSPKAHAKGVEIVVLVRNGAPSRVIGDDGRLRQILFNLVGNAVKFVDEGGVVVEMTPRPGGRLRFSIRDTGPGIAIDKQVVIFEEFTQADASIARRHGGAGLGLAIVKRLAQAMGGEVGVVSKPGMGASFWVELPLPAAKHDAVEHKVNGVRIAIITRSRLLAQAFRGIIISLGAIPVERDERPDVILYDWKSEPSEDEITAMRDAAPAVIALIPQEERGAISKSRELGIENYTLKPVRRRSLVERIKVTLGQADPTNLETKQRDIERAAQSFEGMRVLVAEDNPINALLARTLLTRVGCVVTTAQDGEEAVAAAAAAAYDLIFLDIRMPLLDGYCAAERIRAGQGPSASAPIVALTADAGDADRTRALLAGMDDFLTKPIDAGRLLDVAARFTLRANEASFKRD